MTDKEAMRMALDALTKEQFKKRWESDENGGGITFDDIAKCAESWGLFKSPRTSNINFVRYKVLVAAEVSDAEEYLA
jgi:hypothetical protein